MNERELEIMKDGDFKISNEFIQKLIDDAVNKKDRSVSIFIGAQGTSISVYPLTEEDF
jgi:hypothetical protein